MHDENSFLTLTYNNQNLPRDGSIQKQEMQKFVKRLRRKIEPIKVRFFGAGEYGESFNRPHYHMCLFGFDFPDKQVYKALARGKDHDVLFISKMLEDTWGKGFCTIGEVNFKTAGYVARYVTKKITGKPAAGHYGKKNEEFALMSRSPGIGATWLEKYETDVYPKDFHVINGKKVRPPRYYDSLLDKKKPELFEELKERRKSNVNEDLARASDKDKLYKEKYRKLVTRRLERSYENGDYNDVRDLGQKR